MSEHVDFVVYDATTGKVTETYSMDKDIMDQMVANGIPCVIGTASVHTGVVDLTTKQISNVAPTPPTPSTILTYLQFEALFTPTEQTAIMTAATSNPALLQWLLRAAGAGTIDLSNPETKTGLDMLVSASLITSDRETAILATLPPTP